MGERDPGPDRVPSKWRYNHQSTFLHSNFMWISYFIFIYFQVYIYQAPGTSIQHFVRYHQVSYQKIVKKLKNKFVLS